MPADEQEPQWHVLDFFSDDEGSCALTIFINGVRFHILADADRLDENTEAGAEYHGLIHDLQGSNKATAESRASANGSTASDSGVDVKGAIQDESKKDEATEPDYNVEQTLKKWMVEPLVESLEELAPPLDSSQSQTLHDWYYCTTNFCELLVTEDGKEIQAVQLDATSDLEERMANLIPQTTLPKYISEKLDAPIHNATDLLVLESSDQPPGTPYHPCRLQHRETEEIYFLKIVDNIQPQAMKREIDVLLRIHSVDLAKRFNVPSVLGLVAFDDAGSTSAGKRRFMGFLQTDIPEPTPLNTMLRSDVSQEKRDGWAKEVNEIKELLHEHEIVWGDAKADNFMVDAKDRLWIIDFGGGYTEGWVDPQFNETEEGDNIGTEKIVNALKDPSKNILASDETDDNPKEKVEDTMIGNNKKRKRKEAVVDDEGTRSPETKAHKAR